MGTAAEPALASPIDVANALLLAAARSDVTAVLIEPGAEAHAVAVEGPGRMVRRATLAAAVGSAVAARLALLAGLDVAASDGQQVGRRLISAAGADAELMVVVDALAGALSIEIRRVIGVLSAGDRTPSTPEVGMRVGPYRLVEEIGRGALASVFRAENEVIGKTVAIKFLDAELACEPETVARFLREARVASRIENPRIVQMMDFGSTPEGLAYLVMELVQWPTLADTLEAGPLQPDRAVALGWQIARAVEAAHKSGVLHCDLKPANVFIGIRDEIKLGDFGAAKLVESLPANPRHTATALFRGTPAYMSPEHLNASALSRSTDVYGLGCVLYEMLAGKPPFEGAAVEIAAKQLSDPAPPVTSPYGPLPKVLVDALARALAKRPADRYPTAAALAADLAASGAALEQAGWRPFQES